MSVWYTATVGTPSLRAAHNPRAPTITGEARWTTSGRKSRNAVTILWVGTPTGTESTTGRFSAGNRTTGAPW
jgi:hypothetical protein